VSWADAGVVALFKFEEGAFLLSRLEKVSSRRRRSEVSILVAGKRCVHFLSAAEGVHLLYSRKRKGKKKSGFIPRTTQEEGSLLFSSGERDKRKKRGPVRKGEDAFSLGLGGSLNIVGGNRGAAVLLALRKDELLVPPAC